MRLAVIPARGGSKRIPRKNIKQFFGKPIIAWSIEAALSSGCFDQVIVSTDDQEIAEVAMSFGAEVPFIRPASLADDFTGTAEVVAHAIEFAERERGVFPELTCCIYATAPFISYIDIQEGLKMIRASDLEFVISAGSYPSPIQRAFRFGTNGRLEMFQPESFNSRSQDLEPAYFDAAQFYWGRSVAWKTRPAIFSSNCGAILLDRNKVVDIDNVDDWMYAEKLFRANMN